MQSDIPKKGRKVESHFGHFSNDTNKVFPLCQGKYKIYT